MSTTDEQIKEIERRLDVIGDEMRPLLISTAETIGFEKRSVTNGVIAMVYSKLIQQGLAVVPENIV